MIEIAIGLGIVFSLFFNEVFGVAAGGIVVPGYIALNLHEPYKILGTLAVAFLTYLTIKLVSHFVFIYGRRRLVLAILLGFIFGYISRQLILYEAFSLDFRMQAIGFVIPGLIANWMERQGIIKTLSIMFLTAVIVRLLLILIMGGEVIGNV
ncbi:MAG: poly-gamma-glutamate biosynthesis protein PgsC [candidate division Zixibacteria bacterium]|nr:poly-gamma-glutamate biosynthesis protein PgsC [Candidatus Tariuqbacter arcticus]